MSQPDEAKQRERDRVKKWYSTPQGKLAKRRQNLRRRYGVSLEEYERMFKAANGKCEICGAIDPPRGLFVDHCHNTLKVRGLLCGACNTGLGWYEKVLSVNIEKYLQKLTG